MPSTNTIFAVASLVRGSALQATTFAIFPASRLPVRSATPRASAAAQRDRPQGGLLRKATIDRLADAADEVLGVPRDEGEGNPGLAEGGRVGLGFVDLSPFLFVVRVGLVDGLLGVEVHADQERDLLRLDDGECRGAARLGGSGHEDAHAELVRESQGPPDVVLAMGRDDQGKLPGENVLPGDERRVVARPLLPLGGALVGRPLVAIALGVVEGLARERHHPHQGVGIAAGERRHVEVQGRRLPQDHGVGFAPREVDERAPPREDAVCGNHQGRRDAGVPGLEGRRRPQEVEGEGLWSEGTRLPPVRPALGSAGRLGVEAGLPARVVLRRGVRGRKTEAAERVDQPRGDGQARRVDDTRARGDGHRGTDALDETALQDDGGLFVRGAGDRDHSGSDERVGVVPLGPLRESRERQETHEHRGNCGSSNHASPFDQAPEYSAAPGQGAGAGGAWRRTRPARAGVGTPSSRATWPFTTT